MIGGGRDVCGIEANDRGIIWKCVWWKYSCGLEANDNTENVNDGDI